jgi:hypothetical protein
MIVLLALFGFAPAETQAKWPPALAWLLLLVTCYYAAVVVEWAAWLMPVVSVYFRTVGVLAVAVLLHGLYRAVFHRDALSWSGWLRERVK